MAQALWTPSADRVAGTAMTQFREDLNSRLGLSLATSDDLHAFSVTEPEKFWTAVRDFAGLTAKTWGERVLIDGDKMPGAAWFPDARLNFAENLLRKRDDTEAIVFRGEDVTRRVYTRAQVYDAVAKLSGALAKLGVTRGDRVCGYLPNMPETVIAMLAAASLGATWSSCSPDFGVQGVLDRFGQIEPKVLFATDSYAYGGKRHDVREKTAEVAKNLPSVEKVIILPFVAGETPDVSAIPQAVLFDELTKDEPAGEIAFTHVPFDHPLYIMFSSGTTGAPKCMVHSVGGTLLKHATEHLLHSDVKPGDRVFYFTTCGWMMWNWLVTALAFDAALMLYDGSPFHPGPEVLFDYADEERFTLFGTSAKYIDALAKAGFVAKTTYDLDSVRTICSTGSPLAPESFDYVYTDIKTDVQLASIAGGTDILGCFCAGDPTKPVHRGEIQGKVLGMAVDVFDDAGKSVSGEKGELVCTKPFPSMPVGFWGDDDGSRYKGAYFEQFDNIWTHGDYIEVTGTGGVIIHGRSDATLNPGGVRIGTAEIYRQVEKLDEVVESIVIGQEWDSDVRVILFVRLRDGLTLDDDLTTKIKKQIRANCTPRHVPAKVVQVADIPRTKSGKITELAVRDVVHGRPIKNKEALANPEALKLYENLDALAG